MVEGDALGDNLAGVGGGDGGGGDGFAGVLVSAGLVVAIADASLVVHGSFYVFDISFFFIAPWHTWTLTTENDTKGSLLLGIEKNR